MWVISFTFPPTLRVGVPISLSLMAKEWSTLFELSDREFDRGFIEAHIQLTECPGFYQTDDGRLLDRGVQTRKLSRTGTGTGRHMESTRRSWTLRSECFPKSDLPKKAWAPEASWRFSSPTPFPTALTHSSACIKTRSQPFQISWLWEQLVSSFSCLHGWWLMALPGTVPFFLTSRGDCS